MLPTLQIYDWFEKTWNMEERKWSEFFEIFWSSVAPDIKGFSKESHKELVLGVGFIKETIAFSLELHCSFWSFYICKIGMVL